VKDFWTSSLSPEDVKMMKYKAILFFVKRKWWNINIESLICYSRILVKVSHWLWRETSSNTCEILAHYRQMSYTMLQHQDKGQMLSLMFQHRATQNIINKINIKDRNVNNTSYLLTQFGAIHLLREIPIQKGNLL
jgi:hypothetical protein